MPESVSASHAPTPGDRIVVRTPDQREFRGVLVEFREPASAVVKLDTGWVTTYPLRLISLDLPRHRNAPDQSPGSPTS